MKRGPRHILVFAILLCVALFFIIARYIKTPASPGTSHTSAIANQEGVKQEGLLNKEAELSGPLQRERKLDPRFIHSTVDPIFITAEGLLNSFDLDNDFAAKTVAGRRIFVSGVLSQTFFPPGSLEAELNGHGDIPRSFAVLNGYGIGSPLEAEQLPGVLVFSEPGTFYGSQDSKILLYFMPGSTLRFECDFSSASVETANLSEYNRRVVFYASNHGFNVQLKNCSFTQARQPLHEGGADSQPLPDGIFTGVYSVNEAMISLFGNYDAASKTSQDYSIQPSDPSTVVLYQDPSITDYSGSGRVTGGVEERLLLTGAANAGSNRPSIGVYLFAHRGDAWVAEGIDSRIGYVGLKGRTIDSKFVEVGAGLYGFIVQAPCPGASETSCALIIVPSDGHFLVAMTIKGEHPLCLDSGQSSETSGGPACLPDQPVLAFRKLKYGSGIYNIVIRYFAADGTSADRYFQFSDETHAYVESFANLDQ